MPDLLGPNPWRPEGWVNPEDLPEDGPLDGLDDCGIYEAGADAMLEALKAGGKKIPLGWQVFIPEAQG